MYMEKFTDVVRRRSKISVDVNFNFFYHRQKLRDFSEINIFVKFNKSMSKQ